MLCFNSIIVISNASIRNNIATFIAYIYSHSNPIKKTLHYVIGITSSKAELFAVRCSINQAIQFSEISCSYYWFNLCGTLDFWFIYSSYQQQSIAISKDLWLFFNKQPSNSTEFWDCLSNSKWSLHTLVDKKQKI